MNYTLQEKYADRIRLSESILKKQGWREFYADHLGIYWTKGGTGEDHPIKRTNNKGKIEDLKRLPASYYTYAKLAKKPSKRDVQTVAKIRALLDKEKRLK